MDAVATAVGRPPLLVANAPDAPEWRPDLRTVPDVQPGLGSLGGVYTALTVLGGPIVCVAWDMPFVTPELLQELLEGLRTHDAHIPESHGPRGLEPMCAVYGPNCVQAIAGAVEEGDLRAVGFHARVRVKRLPLNRVRHFGDPGELFFNVNTEADLRRANELWRQRERSRS